MNHPLRSPKRIEVFQELESLASVSRELIDTPWLVEEAASSPNFENVWGRFIREVRKAQEIVAGTRKPVGGR